MKRLALVTVLLYVATLLLLALPVGFAAFAERWHDISQITNGFFKEPLAWMWLGIWAVGFGLIQAALLVVPVRLADERPVGRRHIFWPIAAVILLAGLLIFAAVAAVLETLENTTCDNKGWFIFPYVGVGILWLIWTFLFGFYTGNRPPRQFMARLVRWLVAGSILEFLIAIPAHVLARCRNYCCAGFGTFWGLAVGISVLLIAFGPAAFMLFARRYASIKSSSSASPTDENLSGN